MPTSVRRSPYVVGDDVRRRVKREAAADKKLQWRQNLWDLTDIGLKFVFKPQNDGRAE